MPSSDSPAFESLFKESSDAIVLLDSKRAAVQANLAVERLFGLTPKDFVQKGISSLFPDRAHPFFPKSRSFDADLLREEGRHEDIALKVGSGEIRLFEVFVAKASLTFRDTDERRKIEQELIQKHQELRNMQETLVQAGKLAALGELSAGIAHELNQPLQGIRGFIQEVRDQPGLPVEERKAYLDEVIKNVDRMAKIIQDLRSFTRQSTKDYARVSVRSVVQDVLSLIGKQLANHGVSVVQDFPKDLPEVYVNPNQLQQVLINLLGNAKDAIRSHAPKGEIRIEALKENGGDFVALTVSDDGAGMSESVRKKIFDPFFTTKQAGQGMGLGLSLSMNLIQRMNGTILVQSEEGRGSRFTVRLPIQGPAGGRKAET